MEIWCFLFVSGCFKKSHKASGSQFPTPGVYLRLSSSSNRRARLASCSGRFRAFSVCVFEIGFCCVFSFWSCAFNMIGLHTCFASLGSLWNIFYVVFMEVVEVLFEMDAYSEGHHNALSSCHSAEP